MTNNMIEKNGDDCIRFRFRVTPPELRAMAGPGADRNAAVQNAMNKLVSDACRKAACEYPDILYFTPAVTVAQNAPGRDLIFSADVRVRPVCKLGAYRAVRLTVEDRAQAEKAICGVPAEDREKARLYLLQAALVDRIAAGSTIEVPNAMIDERAAAMAREFQKRLEADGQSMEDYYQDTDSNEKQLLADFAANAAGQLRSRLARLAVARAEGLEASSTEYEEQIQKLSALYPLPPEELRRFFERGEGQRLRQDIAVSKAAAFVAGLVEE